MSNPKIHTSIEKNLVVLLALCLCAEANRNKNFSVKAPVFASLVRISSRKSVLIEYLKYMNGSSDVVKRLESISQADIHVACIDYVKYYQRKGQIKLCQYSTINGAENTIEFQVVVTDDNFTPGYYEKYNSLTLERKIKQADLQNDIQTNQQCKQEGDFTLKTKDKLFSIMLSIVLHCFAEEKPSVYLTSPGSKITFCRNIDLKKLFPVEGIAVEPFGRTAAFSMAANKYLKAIVLNDLDDNVVYYLTCLKEYPLYLIDAIIDKFNSIWLIDGKMGVSSDERKKYCDELRKGMADKHLNSEALSSNNTDNHYNAANIKRKSIFQRVACFFLLVNLSFNGKCDGVNEKRLISMSEDSVFAGRLMRMLSASVVLRKAVITHHDYKWVLSNYKNKKGFVWIFLDSPYIDDKGENDGTYGTEDSKLGKFDRAELEKMCDLVKEAPRVLITHSRNDIVSGIMNDKKIELVGCYDTSINGKGSYVTDVFGRGITSAVFKGKQ